MDTHRRLILKATLAAIATALAGAGMIVPRAAHASWPREAFEAETLSGAMERLFGVAEAPEGAVTLDARDVADNAALFPVTVETTLPGVTSIAILAAGNARPLVAHFRIHEDVDPYIHARIKLAQTTDVIAIVEAGGRLYSTRKRVTVTRGGCEG